MRILKKLIVVLGLVAAAVLLFILIRYLREKPEVEVQPPTRVETYREITLYFASDDANMLIPEPREIASFETQTEGIRAVLKELIKGPQKAGVGMIPETVTVRTVFVKDGVAYIDFSKDIIDDFVGGSASEYLLIASIVRTISANFPDIMGIKILVGGKEVESIGGHLYIMDVLKPKDWR